jgi:hypothetical protein
MADQSRREAVEEAVSEDAVDELDFRVEKRFGGE